MGDVVLSYGDALIRKEELDILAGTGWLNDQIIGFYFEYLQTELFKDLEKVSLIGPEVSQFVKLVSSAEVPSILGSMQLQEKELIIFAVNSMQDMLRAGGSHWSLLVYSRLREEWLHYDSSSNYNLSEAESLAKKVAATIDAKSSRVSSVNDCLQQKNGYDCGCFLLKHAEMLIHTFVKDNTLKCIPKLERDEVDGTRKNLTKLITSLKSR